MEIKPIYISFEQAKLLKEKKIEIDTDEVLFYRDEVNNIKEHQLKNKDVVYYANNFLYKVNENECRTYHQWEFIEWLRINHNIDVEGRTQITSKTGKKEYIAYIDCIDIDYNNRYKTSQEAYSAAFDYILKELI
jgi:hypothetical protein